MNHFLLLSPPHLHSKHSNVSISIPITMDDITHQQMKSVALSGDANKSDANDFNAGLFKYLLFVAKNGGTKNIWSETDKDLKAWMVKQNKEFLRLMSCQTLDDNMMVLNHVNFPWRLPLEVKWNQRYEELVKYHSIHNSCNVPRNVPHLGDWVNNQRQFKKMYDAASKKSSLTVERIEKLNALGFEWDLRT